ncbi:MAG: amino acid ABC transporter ATP-binding protein, partial [Clostridia bacterium]|nr:amino acid ABC transporter ATP-binding protein [Clostridia bacterium]
MSFLEIKRLRKQFGDVTPLRSVSFSVEKGEVVSIIGPSGSGKSTFLRCLNLLEMPTKGTITFEGTDITDP